MSKIKSTPEIATEIIKLYNLKFNTHQIAHQFNCSPTFIVNVLKKYNIPRRLSSTYKSKYIINDNFFDTIDTEEKAYILGFLYADGNNYVNNNCYEVSINLVEEDKSILEEILRLLSPDNKLKKISFKNKNWKNQYRLCIKNKKISDQLTQLGCVPNKSLTLTFPEWLTNKELQRHFIRGYFDGDGSIYSKKPKITGQIDYGWQITSTYNFCSSIKDILENNLNIHCSLKKISKCSKNQITTTVSVGGNHQIKILMDWIYNNSIIYLPRKHNKYLEFINYLIKKQAITN